MCWHHLGLHPQMLQKLHACEIPVKHMVALYLKGLHQIRDHIKSPCKGFCLHRFWKHSCNPFESHTCSTPAWKRLSSIFMNVNPNTTTQISQCMSYLSAKFVWFPRVVYCTWIILALQGNAPLIHLYRLSWLMLECSDYYLLKWQYLPQLVLTRSLDKWPSHVGISWFVGTTLGPSSCHCFKTWHIPLCHLSNRRLCYPMYYMAIAMHTPRNHVLHMAVFMHTPKNHKNEGWSRGLHFLPLTCMAADPFLFSNASKLFSCTIISTKSMGNKWRKSCILEKLHALFRWQA